MQLYVHAHTLLVIFTTLLYYILNTSMFINADIVRQEKLYHTIYIVVRWLSHLSLWGSMYLLYGLFVWVTRT